MLETPAHLEVCFFLHRIFKNSAGRRRVSCFICVKKEKLIARFRL